MLTAQDVFDRSVRPLPIKVRLQLAALILQGLADDVQTIDASDAWSEQDQLDLTSFSLRHAQELYPEAEEFV
jgi:hypothetical protein